MFDRGIPFERVKRLGRGQDLVGVIEALASGSSPVWRGGEALSFSSFRLMRDAIGVYGVRRR